MSKSARISSAALAKDVMARADALAVCTQDEGSITRSYGSAALVEARGLVQSWMEEAGLVVRCDAVGNLIGRWESVEEPAKTFLLGSHIDSVRNAGRYDGPLGVLVAIATVVQLRRQDTRLPFNVDVVAFVDEEGLRYHASYFGSRVFVGLFDEGELDAVDEDGTPLAEAVRRMGGDPTQFDAAKRGHADLLGYCEVHIEQGPLLETRDLPVGVVTAIAGQSRGTVSFIGEAGHAGTVPMNLRRDAFCAASEFVLAVESEARRETELIATVGKATILPGAGNVIPGRVDVTFDVRHHHDAERENAVRRLRTLAQQISDRRELELQWNTLQEHLAVQFAPHLVALLAEAVESNCGEVHLMASGAGHDAVSVAHLTGVSMLFVRCKGGVSHHPAESVEEDDVAVAIEVLGAFLCRLAKR